MTFIYFYKVCSSPFISGLSRILHYLQPRCSTPLKNPRRNALKLLLLVYKTACNAFSHTKAGVATYQPGACRAMSRRVYAVTWVCVLSILSGIKAGHCVYTRIVRGAVTWYRYQLASCPNQHKPFASLSQFFTLAI